jgi:hypothetical protein
MISQHVAPPPLHAIVIIISLPPHSADTTAPPPPNHLPHLTNLTSEGCTGLLRYVSSPGAPSCHAQLLGAAYYKAVAKTKGAISTSTTTSSSSSSSSTPFVKLKTSVIIITTDDNKDTVAIEEAAQEVEAHSITKLTTTDDDGNGIAQQIIAPLSTNNINDNNINDDDDDAKADAVFVFIHGMDISWLENLLSCLIPVLSSSEQQRIFLSLVVHHHREQKQDDATTTATPSSSIVSTLKPRQSYQYSGMVPVDVDEEFVSTVVHSMPGWVRRDGVQSILEVGVVGREGGGGSVLAEHLVPEIAYKIGRAPKYGG